MQNLSKIIQVVGPVRYIGVQITSMNTPYPGFKGLCVLVFTALITGCGSQTDANEKENILAVLSDVQKQARSTASDELNLLNDTLQSINLAPSAKFEVAAFKFTYYFNRNQFLKASGCLDTLFLLIGNYPSIARQKKWENYALESKADLYLKVGRTKEAVVLYNKCIESVEKTSDLFRAATLHYRLAMSDYKAENFTESRRSFVLAMMNAQKVDTSFQQFYFIQEVINNIGLCFQKEKQADSALHYYLTALKYIEGQEKKYTDEANALLHSKALTSLHIAVVAEELNDSDGALRYYKIALNYYNQLNDEENSLFVKYHIAGLYLQMKEISVAENWATPVASIETSNRELLLRQLIFNSTYYAAKKDYKNSYLWLNTHSKTIDSFRLLAKKKEPGNLQAGILQLQEEKKKSALEKNRQITILVIVILSLVILLAVIASVFMMRLFKKKAITERENLEKIKTAEATQEQLQARIKQQNIHFDALICSVEDFLWVVDRDFKLVSYNSAYQSFNEKKFGESLEPGTGESRLKDVSEYTLKWKDYYKRALAGETFQWQEQGITINGYTPTVEFKLIPIKDDNHQIIGISCSRKDVTEVFDRLKQIENQNTRLRKIAWMQSHQARVPVANILGLAYLLDIKGMKCLRKKILSKKFRQKQNG